ncbi:hypothetical protein Msub_10245 [Marinobacter subterrani]|uniref:Uncharacterized protein n=1 Tax=Marinobacter subterrani TaxID=1658765 RepID=A0A0J7J803_9GAMM|nr:hypothetical protein Msub_10245 [Marinobacter subterrani]
MSKPPYRSKSRDKPRTVYGVSPFAKKKGPPPPESGKLNYHLKGHRFSEIFEASVEENRRKITSEFHDEVSRAHEVADLIYELASQYMWLVRSPLAADISPVNDILMPCFHKTQIGVYSALTMTEKGLYGAARPLLRHAFESLMIAKFCSVNNDSEIFDKWVDGLDIYFTNGVLKKIKHPDNDEFKVFWSSLSNYSHSSIYAIQPDLSVDGASSEIDLNFVFIGMLQECKYHLLIRHFVTPSMRYYQARYKDRGRVCEIKERLKQLFTESRRSMAPGAKALIRDYRAAWYSD